MTKEKRHLLDRFHQSAMEPREKSEQLTAVVFLIASHKLYRVVVSFAKGVVEADVATAHKVALEKQGMEQANSIVLVENQVYYVDHNGKHYDVFLVRG